MIEVLDRALHLIQSYRVSYELTSRLYCVKQSWANCSVGVILLPAFHDTGCRCGNSTRGINKAREAYEIQF